MVRGFAKLPVKIVPIRGRCPGAQGARLAAHIETVQHRSTRLTLATREFETAVRVEAKELVAEASSP